MSSNHRKYNNKYTFNEFKKQGNFKNKRYTRGWNRKPRYSQTSKVRHLVNWGVVSLYNSEEKDLLKGMRETYQIDLVLELPPETYLHIGSGITRVVPPLDEKEKKMLREGNMQKIKSLIVLRNRLVEDIARWSDNTPIIPGSSLKGAVRSRLELLLADLYSCFIVSGRARGKPSKNYKHLYSPLNKHRARDVEIQLSSDEIQNISPSDKEYWRKKVCIVCDMFGRGTDHAEMVIKVKNENKKITIKVPALMSKVLFSDAVLITPSKIDKKEKYGVPHYVVVGPATFTTTITAYNIYKVELALLLFGLSYKYKDLPLLLGRYKYYDNKYGRVLVPSEKITIRKIEVKNGIPVAMPFQEFKDIDALKNSIKEVLTEWYL